MWECLDAQQRHKSMKYPIKMTSMEECLVERGRLVTDRRRDQERQIRSYGRRGKVGRPGQTRKEEEG